MAHALWKTFIVFATASCGSYIVIALFLVLAVLLLPFAVLSRVRPSCLPLWLSTIDFTTALKAACVWLALCICFVLPVYIQQVQAVVS